MRGLCVALSWAFLSGQVLGQAYDEARVISCEDSDTKTASNEICNDPELFAPDDDTSEFENYFCATDCFTGGCKGGSKPYCQPCSQCKRRVEDSATGDCWQQCYPDAIEEDEAGNEILACSYITCNYVKKDRLKFHLRKDAEECAMKCNECELFDKSNEGMSYFGTFLGSEENEQYRWSSDCEGDPCCTCFKECDGCDVCGQCGGDNSGCGSIVMLGFVDYNGKFQFKGFVYVLVALAFCATPFICCVLGCSFFEMVGKKIQATTNKIGSRGKYSGLGQKTEFDDTSIYMDSTEENDLNLRSDSQTPK